MKAENRAGRFARFRVTMSVHGAALVAFCVGGLTLVVSLLVAAIKAGPRDTQVPVLSSALEHVMVTVAAGLITTLAALLYVRTSSNRGQPVLWRTRGWFLRRESRQQVLLHVILGLVIITVLRSVLALLGAHFAELPPVAEGVLDTFLAGMTTFVIVFLVTRSLGSLWGVSKSVAEKTINEGSPEMFGLVEQMFRGNLAMVEGLLGDGHVAKTTEELASLFTVFFGTAEHSTLNLHYIGIDSHTPSNWWNEFEFYLTIHAASIKARKDADVYNVNDERILLVSSTALNDDYGDDDSNYNKFVEWHVSHEVDLFWIDPVNLTGEARRLYQELASDAAIGEHLALLFNEETEGTRVRAAPRQPSPRASAPTTQAGYEIAAKFAAALATDPSKRALHVGPPDYFDVVDQAVADVWNEYVGYEARLSDRDNPLGQFLVNLLDEVRPAHDALILDAAAGTGCDAIYLLKRNLAVELNEVDPKFSQIIARNLDDPSLGLAPIQGVPASKTVVRHAARWQTLREKLSRLRRYHVVIVVGNSFCLVKPEDRQRCIRELASLLFEGGLLVIDERNFELIIDRADDIARSFLDAYPSALEPDVVYRGRTVRGAPIKVTDTEVLWRIYRPPAADDAERRVKYIGDNPFVLYPLRHGDLFRLLERDFEKIDVYADLEPLPDEGAMPSRVAVGDAVFLTYAARKRSTQRGG